MIDLIYTDTVNKLTLMCEWDVIIAHGPGCFDGATAAWAVWRTLPKKYRSELAEHGGFYGRPKQQEDNSEESSEKYIHPNSPLGALKLQDQLPVVFVFIQPGNPVPISLVTNKRVLILDLDMGDELVHVVTVAKSVKLCDHHDSTMSTIRKHSDILLNQYRDKFSMLVDTRKSESGASLAWRLTHDASIPQFVDVIRIGDTWQWNEYPEARCILDAFYVKRVFRSFQDIEDTFTNFEEDIQKYIDQGRIINEYKESLCKSMAKHCDLGYLSTIDGKVYTVAYTSVSALRSEVGSKVKFYAEKRFGVPIDFTCLWTYMPSQQMVQVSLRDPQPGLNLGDISRNISAPNCKGGGHPQASGFTFSGIENFHQVFKTTAPNVSDSITDVSLAQPTDLVTGDNPVS